MPAMFFGILGTSGESVYVTNNISFESNGGEKLNDTESVNGELGERERFPSMAGGLDLAVRCGRVYIHDY
tara:strand:+ start:235 stop:444 length:210 start_codon:yes stop_codon:yes gene_type:complete